LHGALSLRWELSATGYQRAGHRAAVLAVVGAVVVVACDGGGFKWPVVVDVFVLVVPVVVAVIVWMYLFAALSDGS
jgi:hypothetical protein